MRASQFLLKTTKDDPAEAEIVSHRLMLRSGSPRLGVAVRRGPLLQRVHPQKEDADCSLAVARRGSGTLAPMDWSAIVQQLRDSEEQEGHIALPITGTLLAARVRIAISGGTIDLNVLLRLPCATHTASKRMTVCVL